MDILLLLPFLKGWESDAKQIIEPFSISAGKSKTIVEYKVPKESCYGGWSLIALATLNNKNGTITIKHDIREFETSPLAMYGLGLVKPNPYGFFVSVYDTTINLFVMNYMPARPLWFKRYAAFDIGAPADEDLTVSLVGYTVIRISNMNEFRQSLKELLGSELQRQILESLAKPPVPTPTIPRRR